jgi:cysteine-rich repeat protein
MSSRASIGRPANCWARLRILIGAIAFAVLPVAAAEAVCTPPDCGLDFGSAGAYVTFGNTPSLGLSTFTIETWLRRDGAGASASTGTGAVTAIPLVTKGRGEADGDNRDMNWFLGLRASDGVLIADFEEGAAGSSPGLNHPVVGTTPVPSGVWSHAAVTYDGSTWRLYLNGVLETTLAVNQPTRSDSIQHAALATALTSTGAASGAFDGELDEVRVWSVARSGAQIQAAINQVITTDPTLVAHWGLDEGSGTTIGDTSGTAQVGTLTGTGASWEPGAPFSLNTPPLAPALVAPANAATGVSLSPQLIVSAVDPDADPMTVRFYGREVSAAAPDFSLIALPDTQFYSSSLNGGTPAIFNAQTQWIVDQRASRNIAYVAQLGDCVQNGNNGGNDVEWQVADAAISLLEDPITTQLAQGMPYGIAVGNHDQSPIGDPEGTPPGNSTASYNNYFGISRFLGRSYYGGHYGTSNDNHYDLFSAGGMDFIVIVLEYDTSPDAAVLSWANALLQSYPERRAIVVSHWIVNTGNPATFGAQGQAIYDALKSNPNLFMMLSGHVCSEGRRQDTFNGHTVDSMLSDYQCDPAGGNGWLRILTFRPAQNQIVVETYSPSLGQFRAGDSSSFTLNYDMGGAGFSLIGSQSGVASGTNASVTWNGLANGSQYEWYATADDGVTLTKGPVLSFTTTTGGCGDGQIDPGETCDDGASTGGDGCSAACQIEPCWACAGAPSLCSPDNGASCDDGQFCNGADVCSGGSCVSSGDPCVGGSECADVCNEATDQCADPLGTACTADANGCTDDVCDGAGACGVNNTAPCDDGQFCTVTDFCSGGVCIGTGDPCVGGSECAASCDEGSDQCADPLGTACSPDGNVCTDDVCNGAGACGTLNTASCDDGNACTVQDTCSVGVCDPGTLITTCTNGDGCCAAGCNFSNDDDCTPVAPVPVLWPRATFLLIMSLFVTAWWGMSRAEQPTG